MDKRPDQIDQLLGQLGPRTQPDEQHSARHKQVVKAQWLKAVKRRQQRIRMQWAMAASLVLIFTVSWYTWWPSEQPKTPAVFGTLLAVNGPSQIKTPGQAWQNTQMGQNLTVGSQLQTADGGQLSWLAADHSLISLAANTHIEVGAGHIKLLEGQLYHDTDQASVADPLSIITPLGAIEHIGTRYLVAHQNQQLAVAVRSGAVRLTPTDGTNSEQQINSQQWVKLEADGPAQVQNISLHDPLWDWTFQALPAYDLSDKSLHEFIVWYAHQRGLDIDWQGLESSAKRVRLQGQIKNMSAEQAIQTVFLSTSYHYQIDHGRLQISQQ